MTSNPLIGEGFAIRRDTGCLAGLEIDCGITRPPFRGCCPIQYTCPNQWNIACCPSGTNCTDTLVAAPQPKCSNATWDLFDNNGPFCCEHGLRGYNISGTNGCGRPGGALDNGAQLLSTVRVGVEVSTSATSSGVFTSTPVITLNSASATSSSTPAAESSSSTPVATIAGGVVGGVVGIALLAAIIWFLMRKKRNKAVGPHGAELQGHWNPYPMQQQYGSEVAVKDRAVQGQQTVHEVGYGARIPDVELSAETRAVEMDGRYNVRN